MGHIEPTTTIKSESPEVKVPLFFDGDSDPGSENQETDLNFFAHRGLDSRFIPVNLDPKIHYMDIEQFVHFGFDEQLNHLTNSLGFQIETVQDIYKQVHSFKQLKEVIKAMHASAMDCAKAEIEAQEMKYL
ncbi:uncharacterized protein EDB93DRAFT_1101655 [Suillus bovinus]|uniref:uncharacterized protein n=1 Tax=Suillus bovinus TaxID=48563 RepID=UPI001B86F987|nr:uncharacterized protein EDB93DRAFT_1101655 [Suillus bovinus]KAG2155876.1 hypothetical protein EDB93DRAFT_1101655 [Suillus bovinus]